MRPEAIKKLMTGGSIQRGRFDERNLFELTHPDFAGERLMACRNPELAERRARKRTSLLDAATRELGQVSRMVSRGQLRGNEAIGTEVEKILKQDKIGKHYKVDIREAGSDYQLDRDALAAEVAAKSPGKNVVRSSVSAETMNSAQTVRSHKLLSNVERAFRCLKSVDLNQRLRKA